MPRVLFGLAVLGCAAAIAGATPLLSGRLGQLKLAPSAAELHTFPAAGGERAVVIVSGQGTSPLSAYVFDPRGNCVGKDDVIHRKSYDDAAVEWFPTETAVYTVELRNIGTVTNVAQVAFR